MKIIFNRIISIFRRGINHDRLISIRANGRDTFLYSEGDHRLTIYAELLMGNIERRIYTASIRNWAKPFKQENITEVKRKEILLSICEYFNNRNITFDIIDDGPNN